MNNTSTVIVFQIKKFFVKCKRNTRMKELSKETKYGVAISFSSSYNVILFTARPRPKVESLDQGKERSESRGAINLRPCALSYLRPKKKPHHSNDLKCKSNTTIENPTTSLPFSCPCCRSAHTQPEVLYQ